jgi:hypothetical protein
MAKAEKGDIRMRKILSLIAFVALAVIALSCASDIVLEEPPSLKGVYKGRYIVTFLEEDRKFEQVVDWVFDDKYYHMDIDVDDPIAPTLQCICNYDGVYILEERVRLSLNVAPDPPGDIGSLSCDACDQRLEPVGSFDLIRPPDTDSLKLTYLDTENQYKKQILLIKATGE